MAEFNTIYDSSKNAVGTFRHGVAWSRNPRQRLGEYDYGDTGLIYDNDGKCVAKFENGRVTASDNGYIGHHHEVPFAEMSDNAVPLVSDALVKRLQIGERVVGWCIGNPGSACAALLFLFSKGQHARTLA